MATSEQKHGQESIEEMRFKRDEQRVKDRETFAASLEQLAGINHQNFEMNRTLAEMIQDTANDLRVLFDCPKCGDAGRLKCAMSGNSRTGAFSIVHGRGKTHGASSALPKLKLIDHPFDNRKRAKEDPHGGLELTQLTIEEPSSSIHELHHQTSQILKARRAEFLERLRNIAGTNYENFDLNRELAQIIQEEANLLRVLFACPKCDEPGRLKCVQAGRNNNGVFSFSHKGGMTHSGTTTLPLLTLVEPLEDKRKRKKSTK